ncbi:hypothetical protein [Companilactobacillus baiquanensis]|uniref:DUF805 domain-containing protein n=1 Tax=Companilactobacillus baiquanensis TaxID=2486005 RepID=A0ABW1UT18_9LACO|nr:hypothetical protein [Companilactobacillus baiquanensis]
MKSKAQVSGWIVFWITNILILGLILVSIIHPKYRTSIPYDLSSTILALVILIFIVIIQIVVGMSIKKLHQNIYWPVVLLAIGAISNWLYLIPSIWGIILNRKKMTRFNK